MTRVLCALDGSRAALAAAEAAIDFCREHDAELELLSVVGAGTDAAAQAATRLEEARLIAEAVGLTPTTSTRSGRLLPELQRRADESGAHMLFFPRTRSAWWAALSGRPRFELEQLTVALRPDRPGRTGAPARDVHTDRPAGAPHLARARGASHA
jgi:nucleotide-binding universal stress UspA family protein